MQPRAQSDTEFSVKQIRDFRAFFSGQAEGHEGTARDGESFDSEIDYTAVKVMGDFRNFSIDFLKSKHRPFGALGECGNPGEIQRAGFEALGRESRLGEVHALRACASVHQRINKGVLVIN